ncbi:cytochrome c [Vibrio kasasachensis]|uniref:c-type cytochrome n=1 Tax=Vibrio kasasachensis TaxID=2910248 RepID=UPI003D149E95
MKRALGLAVAGGILAVAASSYAVADDTAAGKAKAITCVACHGTDGISPIELYPNLAGQKKGYLVKQMKAFKDGSRKDPTMNAMVAALSDKDIENISAYYSKL